MPSWSAKLFSTTPSLALGSSSSSSSASTTIGRAPSNSTTTSSNDATTPPGQQPILGPPKLSPNSSNPPRVISIFPPLDPSAPTLFARRNNLHARSQSTNIPGKPVQGGEQVNIGSFGAVRRGRSNSTPEMKVGQCMTCSSTVRWPVHLTVFRCTVCLTINDLVPANRGAGRPVDAGTAGKGKARESSPVSTPMHTTTISLERTNAIIKDCLDNFIRARRAQRAQFASSPTITPNSSTTAAGPRRIPKINFAPAPTPTLATPSPYHAFEDNKDKDRSDYFGRPRTSESVTPSGTGRQFPPPRTPETPGVGGGSGSASSGSGNSRQRTPADSVANTTGTTAGGEGVRKIETAVLQPPPAPTGFSPERLAQRALTEKMFRPLEEYIVRTFVTWESINSSFQRADGQELADLLLLSDSPPGRSTGIPVGGSSRAGPSGLSMDRAMRRQREKLRFQSPWIDWADVSAFYEAILTAGDYVAAELYREEGSKEEEGNATTGGKTKNRRKFTRADAEELEADIDEARDHLERTLLKAIEHVLKRPGKPLITPEDSKALLILLVCPLLHPSSAGELLSCKSRERRLVKGARTRNKPQDKATGSNASGPGQHSGIIKRVLGLLSNLPNETHHYLVSWFSRMYEPDFRKLVEFAGSFITYRLTKQFGKSMAQGATDRVKGVVYADDWQIRAASKVLSLLSAANNAATLKKKDESVVVESWFNVDPDFVAYDIIGEGNLARKQAMARGHIIPTSDFYNSMLDYADLIADFDQWEAKIATKFCFCQYPFLLSMGSKIQILEYDAKRQMELKAREAFFNSIGMRRTFSQHLLLRVRRDCLVEDSLKGISETVGGGAGDIKKGLRIEFDGEDGIDIGGLRKEWFLLLVREVFDPRHGMFVYDEDSRYCYFNPNTFEATEQFFLVGVLLGLAIYNSTILDVALPPVVFKKLLSPSTANVAPSKLSAPSSTARHPYTSTLDDLSFFRPTLARGLRQLLEFEGDVETTFCRDFVVEVERYGQTSQVPLLPGGENRPVTNENRREFVDLYTQYLLDTSVARQFDPFKRGFWTVCGGNALSLFQPDEIELLVRGSDEPLDIGAVKAVAIYENFSRDPAELRIIDWFWETFEAATPEMQRMLLGFITGSDRIPAMGVANLVLKISFGGPSSLRGRSKAVERYPIARTCFNSITLWGYDSKEKLEKMLWRAVRESEGFGLK